MKLKVHEFFNCSVFMSILAIPTYMYMVYHLYDSYYFLCHCENDSMTSLMIGYYDVRYNAYTSTHFM